MSKSLRQVHEDEQGMETLQVVMIIALAAIVLYFVNKYWGNIKTWFDTAVNNITNWTS
jgi:hypothetical protein